MSSPRTIRAGLIVLAVSQIWVGLWALFAPLSFHDGFPGGGHLWIAPYGGFDPHLTTDLGATFIALSVLLVLAAVWMERHLVQAALVAWLILAIPHLIFHLNTLSMFEPFDYVPSLIGLGVQAVLPLVLLALTWRSPASQPVALGGAS